MSENKRNIQARADQLVRNQDQLLEDLIAARVSQGLTQAQVAERIGITQPAVAVFERYDANPTLETISRYAHAIGALITYTVTVDAS